MIRKPAYREAGCAAVNMTLVISLGTTFLGRLHFCYCVLLEPVMMAITPVLLAASDWFASRRI